MLKKNSVNKNINHSSKNSYFTAKNNSRSSMNQRKNNIFQGQNNKYRLTNSNSVQKGNIINTETFINKDKINQLKSYLPYIPNKERLKAEDNFIDLVKSIVNSRNTDKNMISNISVKNKKNQRYKPRGYGYFEYIREHPILIRDLDQNVYSKIIRDIDKKIDNENDLYKENNTLANSNRKEYTLNKKNNLTEANLLSKNQFDYFQTQANNNKSLEKHKNEGIIKGNLKIKINDNNKEKDDINKINQDFLPMISEKSLKQKDYHKSDIFYLVNDSLSKGKSSEQYLFKPNYSPRKLEKSKKTNINEVGWEPKLEKNKSRIGCSSVAFNIINPDLKCLSPMKKEIDILNKNNFEKAPLISDYIDMCKPGDTGTRKEFNDIYEENKNVFHRKNYCASYYDLHHEYKDIVNNVF